MREVTEEEFKHAEKVLGIKLHDHQRKLINNWFMGGLTIAPKGCGKTTAYKAIGIILEIREP